MRYFKVGGLRFLRVGRLQFSWCVCKRKPARITGLDHGNAARALMAQSLSAPF